MKQFKCVEKISDNLQPSEVVFKVIFQLIFKWVIYIRSYDIDISGRTPSEDKFLSIKKRTIL